MEKLLVNRMFLFAFAVIANIAICKAAEIKLDSSPSGDVFVAIRGDIESGDAARLRKLLSRAPNDNDKRYSIVPIVVNSHGGDVKEAIAMAKIISRILAPVIVEHDGLCASACFFVWLAGVPHIAFTQTQIEEAKRRVDEVKDEDDALKSAAQHLVLHTYGIVGLHRPYLTNIQSPTNDQGKVMKLVRDYLDEKLVSRRLIDTMLSRPSNEIYWLTKEDITELGIYPPDVEEFLIKNCGYRRDNKGESVEEGMREARCNLSSLSELRKSRQAELGR